MMSRSLIFSAAALLLAGMLPGVRAQEPADPLAMLFPAGAKLEKVTGAQTFDTAGSPCWLNGSLFFTNNNFDDLEKSQIMRMDAPGTIRILRTNNGMTAALRLSPKGTFYACEMMAHRVTEVDTSGAVLRVVVGEYAGKRIDGPNDLVFDRKGGFYFTDSQFIGTQTKVQDIPAVYYVRADGTVVRVVNNVVFPNGIALSPDGRTLYLANTQGKYLIAYTVAEDGSLSNGRTFAAIELTPANVEKGVSGTDGIAVDGAGNIYAATTQGLGVQVFDPAGKHLGNISCPAPVNNCSFGGPDGKTLYVSAKDGIYSIPVLNAGLKNF